MRNVKSKNCNIDKDRGVAQSGRAKKRDKDKRKR